MINKIISFIELNYFIIYLQMPFNWYFSNKSKVFIYIFPITNPFPTNIDLDIPFSVFSLLEQPRKRKDDIIIK